MKVNATSRTTIRTLQFCGQDIRVGIRPGDGSGTPLLLCSGIGISFEVFDLLVDSLDPDLEIIRVDVPGVGGSPDRLLPYSFPELAGLLAAILDQLGHAKVDVLGFSWGGALAQQFAVQCRDRCRRLILISTSTGMLSIPGSPEALSRMLTPQNMTVNDAASLLYDEVGLHGDEVRRLFRKTQIAASGLGYLYQLVAMSCWTSLPFLQLIRQPTLVIGGDADPIVPVANARLLAKLIPHAVLHTFAGGHIEPLASPDEFSRLISLFLTSKVTASAGAAR
ncbi:MAG: alpha/beta hydrolase [Nakamurella sp.]